MATKFEGGRKALVAGPLKKYRFLRLPQEKQVHRGVPLMKRRYHVMKIIFEVIRQMEIYSSSLSKSSKWSEQKVKKL